MLVAVLVLVLVVAVEVVVEVGFGGVAAALGVPALFMLFTT